MFSDCIMDMDAISTESLKRVSREEDLLRFKKNHFTNHAETPFVFHANVVTKSTAPNVVDIKEYRASALTLPDVSETSYLEVVSS